VVSTFALLFAGAMVVALPARKVTAPTTVSITFDDALAEQNAAADVLHKYRLNGTFYINSGAVGTPGYFGQDDLKRLASLGHEIAGHTVSHLNLTTLPEDETRRQVCTDRATLTSWGFKVTSLAYPYATHNRSTEAIARDCGYNSARMTGGIRRPGKSPGSCPNCPAAETTPPADPYLIRTPQEIDTSWTLADMKGVVTNAEDHGGGWVVLVLHHECDQNCSRLSTSPAVLDAFAAWLKPRQASGTRVKTVDQVIGGAVRPAVAAPPAPTHGVVNPSLESSSGTGIPDCWLRTGWGTNSAQWEQTGAAHSGAKAQHVTITSYTDGDAKLLQRLDLGECTQLVTPRSHYVLQTWYESSAPTQYALYYRTPSGRWTYWTSSSWFPPSRHWAQASWTTPPAPDDAAGLAFGLALFSLGSLTTDDYTMTPTPDDAMTPTPAPTTPTNVASGLPPLGGLAVVTSMAVLAALGIAGSVWRRKTTPAPHSRTPTSEDSRMSTRTS
jgi:peptidoglycan/xylan/chitin deacetylase (PgdA/CDA1 family)